MMRVKHATLGKDAEGNVIFVFASQTKQRDTSATYNPHTNKLVIAGREIAKHPKFPNVDKFEGFVNTYFAEGKDEKTDVKIQQKEAEKVMNIEKIIKSEISKYAGVAHVVTPSKAIEKFKQSLDRDEFEEDVRQWVKEHYILINAYETLKSYDASVKSLPEKCQNLIPKWEDVFATITNYRAAYNYLEAAGKVVRYVITLNRDLKGNPVWESK